MKVQLWQRHHHHLLHVEPELEPGTNWCTITQVTYDGVQLFIWHQHALLAGNEVCCEVIHVSTVVLWGLNSGDGGGGDLSARLRLKGEQEKRWICKKI